jgi:cadmium resistance protein CadD (predicted permease)
LLELLGVTALTFVGTALDNLLLLTVLRTSGTAGRDIVAGFIAGSLVVLALCATGTGLSAVLPAQYLGYLGIIPVGFGVAGLAGSLRSAATDSPPAAGSGVLGIASLQVASSFDSIAAFLPLFADTERPYGFVIAAGFAVMTLLWLLLASTLARLPGITSSIQPFERYARPIVLILVGLYVLANTRTDFEPDSPMEAAGTTRVITQPQRPRSLYLPVSRSATGGFQILNFSRSGS